MVEAVLEGGVPGAVDAETAEEEEVVDAVSPKVYLRGPEASPGKAGMVIRIR